MISNKLLTNDDKLNIDKLLRRLHDLLPQLDRAEECGVNCVDHRADVKELQAKLTKLKELF